MDLSEFKYSYSNPKEFRNLTAKEIAKDMESGWNLGNSLEAEKNETYWGNPKTTKIMIDKISQRGFKTLRVPVRWDNHYTDSNYTIEPEFMNRVETVINYGLSNNMYVIINIHHNAIQTMVNLDQSIQNRVKNEMAKIWTQVGNRFKEYGDKLIFETINEPRLNEDWTGNQTLYKILNDYNETARMAIRNTGGNNLKRLILIPTYCASSDIEKLHGWESLSDDKMIAVSIHAYKPFIFAFDGSKRSDWNKYDDQELNITFNNMKSCFLDKGIAIVIGEFGSVNKNNINHRILHASKYAEMAKSLGIPCAWWDNNCFGFGSEQFGIFDRKKLEFKFGEIADAIINAYKGKSQTSQPESKEDHQHIANTSNEESNLSNFIELFKGSESTSNWGQAVSILSMKNEGPFGTFSITRNGFFYVEYKGKKDQVELILQSWSGGEKWAKVAISESGEINDHFYCKFSYNNLVSSFKSDEFSSKLDKIYVGAKFENVTVYCLRYYYDGNLYNESENNAIPSSEKVEKPFKSGVLLFEGSADSSNWGQAISMLTSKNNGDFNLDLMKANGFFYVEYSGKFNEIELILQSWSGGEKWAKVLLSDAGKINQHFYAIFTYEDCVDAFGSSDFKSLLDKIYVGAKADPITVYSFYYSSKQI